MMKAVLIAAVIVTLAVLQGIGWAVLAESGVVTQLTASIMSTLVGAVIGLITSRMWSARMRREREKS